MRYLSNILVSTLTLLLAGCVASSDSRRAEQIGLDYSSTAFDVALTGTRDLGEDENFRISGTIKALKKRVTLGEPFVLERPGIISLSGTLTRKDEDRLVLIGSYRGKDRRGENLELVFDGLVIDMAIHGAIVYFRPPEYEVACMEMASDWLYIYKVKRSDVNETQIGP